MRIWDLHPLDLAIIVAFLIAVLAVGVRVSRGVKHESDFYVGGRRMGRALQFFLNFGNATDSNGAVTMASEVFRQGAGGVWLSLQTLFITPFFWFTQPWFRRARVITMADLFVDRYNSKAVASAYAIFNIIVALILLGVGNRGSYEVAAAALVKPESAYTVQDRARVDGFRELHELRSRRASIGADELAKLGILEDRYQRGELSASISYIQPVPFYVTYCAIVAIYIMLGGINAAAVTDAIQGLLILLMSIILIPAGLTKVGGFAGLHARVPAHAFDIFGSVATSEYTWYSIAAITFASLIQVIGLSHNMSSAGSARDENTARFGMISGGFAKRLVLIAWMLCGLLAIGLLSNSLSEPDRAWGALSKLLLGPGLMGLMLAGMLLGHMPSVGVSSVAVSGLVTRNLYEPMVPGKSQKHYLRFGQVTIAFVLGVSIIIAFTASSVTSLLKVLITFNTFFGAAVFLLFFWRRLTPDAILISCVIWVLLIGVAPIAVPAVPALRQSSALVDVTGDRSRPCFFEQGVARVDPNNPAAGYEGLGRFISENYVLSLVGVPVQKFSAAGMVASRWLFDALFPFVCLIGFSLVTKSRDPARAACFYAKMKTPVAPTPELDRIEVEKNCARPNRWDHLKLFPGSNWEFTKWSRADVVGFVGCWFIVGAILLVLIGIVRIGAGS